MSHVVKCDLEIRDLKALASAAKLLGMELRENQKTYRYWGHWVGDFPLPEGFTSKDLGKCDHAISVVGKPNAYEVGVCNRRDGKQGFTLLWDFYAGGKGLVEKIGKDGNKLKQSYAEAVATRACKMKGFKVQRKIENGKVVLTAFK